MTAPETVAGLLVLAFWAWLLRLLWRESRSSGTAYCLDDLPPPRTRPYDPYRKTRWRKKPHTMSVYEFTVLGLTGYHSFEWHLDCYLEHPTLRLRALRVVVLAAIFVLILFVVNTLEAWIFG